jgi:hypothetical protein
VGRPSALTRELADELIKALDNGNTIANACALAGVGEATYHRWIVRGEQAAELLEHEPQRDDYPNAKAHKAALSEWRKRCTAEQPFREFRERSTRARARVFDRATSAIVEALEAQAPVVVGKGADAYVELVPDHPTRAKVAIELLKRRDPENWTDGKRIEHAGAVTVEGRSPAELSPEERAALDALSLELGDEA